MKAIVICLFVALAAAFFCRSAYSDDSASAVVKPGPATAQVSGDAASDLVASFYKALLQEEPPTREQEKALFNEPCIVRTRLVVGRRQDPEDGVEPMNRTPGFFERRREDEAKAAAAGPVVLNYLRNHKDWFLPIGRKKPDVAITSLTRYVRGIDDVKDAPKEGQGFVLAIVGDLADGRRAIRTRVVIFPIENGKIDVAWIHLNGHDSPMIMEEVKKEP